MVKQLHADKGETTAVDDVFRVIANKIPDKEDDIMTIAERLMERGMQQGAHQEKIEIARNLLSMGLSENS